MLVDVEKASGSSASLDLHLDPAPDRPPFQGLPVEQGKHVELRRGHHCAAGPSPAAAEALAGGEEV